MARPTVEINVPELFKFEAEGDALEGLLLSLQQKPIKTTEHGKEITKLLPVLTIAEAEWDDAKACDFLTGRKFEFIAGADLAKKIDESMVGYVLAIRWEGVIPTKNGNMRDYKVQRASTKFNFRAQPPTPARNVPPESDYRAF